MGTDLIALRLLGQLQFCVEMQTTLRRWHPEHEWIVTPQIVNESGDGVSFLAHGATATRFLILAGEVQPANRQIKPFMCLACGCDEYYKAEDPEKWLRRAAGQMLSELCSRRTSPA